MTAPRKNNAPARVLVTDADSPKALAIVRAIGRQHEVWTAAESRLALAGWSRYAKRHLTYSFTSAHQFPEWLLSTCSSNDIDIVITPEEATSLLVARHQDEFTDRGICPTNLPLAALEIVMDKARTVRVAEDMGIPIPPTRTLDHTRDAVKAAQELGYPVVIKPRFSRYWTGDKFIASDGVGYATSDQQLLALMRTLDPRLPAPLLQKFIPGTGCGVCLLISQDGTLCAEFAHERLRDYRPTGSGSVLRRSAAVDSRLRELSLRLMRKIGAYGVAMVEFRVDSRTHEPYLMEVNGRFWGSLQLAIDAGVNFPGLLVDLALGKSVKKPAYEENVVLRWWIGDFVRTLRVLNGKPVGYIGQFPSRISALREFLGPQPAGTRNEILRWSDWRPSFVEPISMMRKVFR
jgi:predicted ATP-grasp superfamily ATP-dependent carboligase